MLVPRPRLLLLVAAAILPLALAGAFAPDGLAAVVAACAMLTAIAVADGVVALRRPGALTAEFPTVTRLGKSRPASLPFTLINERPSERRLLLGFAFPSEIDGEPLDVHLARGATKTRFEWPLLPHRRGSYWLDCLHWEEASPLGMWAARGTIAVRTEVRVYPDLFAERRSAPTLFLKRSGLGAHAHRQVGRGREFEKLRDYIAGDSLQDISWKATARRQRPVSKVYQIERTQEVYALIDHSRLSGRPVDGGGATALEKAIHASLLLCLAAQRQGDHFGLATFADQVSHFLRAGSGTAHFNRCRDAIFAVEPVLNSPDYEEFCAFLKMRLRRRSLLIFLTSLDDPVLAESFTRGVALLSRQHVVLVGMPRPSGVQPLFSNKDEVRNADDVYRSLSGHLQWEKLQQRQRLLRRLGVRFALLDSAEMARQLIDRYASIKQRQAL